MRRTDSRRGIVVLVPAVLLWASYLPAEQPSAGTSALTEVRRASPDIFTLQVEVERPANGELAGQGNATHVMRVTVGREVTAMVWKASHLPDAKYYPPDTPGYQQFDYNAEGNLVVSMWSEGAIIRDQIIHEEYSESTGFHVAPDGTAVRQSSGALLKRRRPSDSNTVNLFLLRAVRWALGRPPTDYLGESEAEGPKLDGAYAIRLAGQFSGHSGLGIWDLVVDPANGHLVRSGSFGARGEEPRMQCRSEGTRWFGNVALAERGEFILGRAETISVRLLSFSPTLDAELVGEARKMVARARTQQVQVMDYRVEDPTQRLRLVPAGDLDKEK